MQETFSFTYRPGACVLKFIRWYKLSHGLFSFVQSVYMLTAAVLLSGSYNCLGGSDAAL